jgi:hypothetical protein
LGTVGKLDILLSFKYSEKNEKSREKSPQRLKDREAQVVSRKGIKAKKHGAERIANYKSR